MVAIEKREPGTGLFLIDRKDVGSARGAAVLGRWGAGHPIPVLSDVLLAILAAAVDRKTIRADAPTCFGLLPFLANEGDGRGTRLVHGGSFFWEDSWSEGSCRTPRMNLSSCRGLINPAICLSPYPCGPGGACG